MSDPTSADSLDEPRPGFLARLGAAASKPQLWIALVSVVGVLSTAVVDMGKTSPGPLAAPHGRIDALNARAGCADCHGGVFQSMTAACLDCHEPIAEHMESGRGLHGALEQEFVGRCATCHSDHHGGRFQLVNAASFTKAGIPERGAFQHDFVGFEMAGKHLELECAECHTNADIEILPEGEQRFLGLAQDCASCHEDVHEGQLASLSCTACHTQTDFEAVHSAGHEDILPLIGGHSDVSCRECHAEGDAHSLEQVTHPRRVSEARNCTTCHDSPHAPVYVEGVARLVHQLDAAACVECHEPEHLSFREDGLSISPELHAPSGFRLELPHAEQTCAECHDPALETFEQRYPGRLANDCAACHEDPHGGQFQRGPNPSACIDCHSGHEFEPHVFDEAAHARTSFALADSHLAAECSVCHERESETAPRGFRDTPSDCDACHADAHESFFVPFVAGRPSIEHGECARCHDATRFEHVPEERFDHHDWTAFPLDGSHLASDCEACHVPTPEPDALGRRFGRVAQCFGPMQPGGESCAVCHEDPHAGGFETADLPVTFEDRNGCQRCHEPVSFRALPHGFDHGLWTHFALDGAHESLSCSSCHARLRRPDEQGRTWAPARGSACADCHDDPHQRQFERKGVTDCMRCHGSTVDFRFLSFEHNWDSRFPLKDKHTELECSACHLPERAGEAEFTRYRPLGTDCIDCHGIQEGALGRDGPSQR